MAINGLENMSGLEIHTEIQKGGKFVIFPYVISLLVITFRRNSGIYFIKADESAVVKSMPYILLSLVVGWWGIPFGIIFTPISIITNLRGGKDVTTEVLASIHPSRPIQNVNLP